MSDAVMQPCAATEGPARRTGRIVAATLLVLLALVECAAAGLMYAGGHGVAQLLYMLCGVGLLSASIVAVRDRARALLAVRVLSIATAVMLLWASSAGSAPSVALRGGHVHDLTPWLAAALLVTLLLPKLLLRPSQDVTCNCG